MKILSKIIFSNRWNNQGLIEGSWKFIVRIVGGRS